MAAIELINSALFTDPNIISNYRMESGALTTDAKGANTLTNNGPATSGTGLFGGGLAVANNSQFLSTTTDMGINGTNQACTFMGWWKVGVEVNTGQQYNLTYQQSVTTHMAYWIDYEYNSGTRRLTFARFKNGVSNDQIHYTVTLGTSNWHHIAMTFDGSNLSGYLDGVLVAGPTAFSGNGNTGMTNAFDIAQDTTNGDLNDNHGIYDDVTLFSRALTAAEIALVYNGPAGNRSIAFFM